MRTIRLIRHGESDANLDGRWRGSVNSGLSLRGVDQAKRLGERFNVSTARVIASDLRSAVETARVLSDNPVLDVALREQDIGAWQGLTKQQITAQFPQEIEALLAGRDAAPGGGEFVSDFADRVVAAFDALVASMHDGETTHVVTHGGVISVLLSHVIGLTGTKTAISNADNASVTVISVSDTVPPQLTVFNDATHLNKIVSESGHPGNIVTLIRHGETESNRQGRWNGRTDSELSARGREQAAAAASQLSAIEQLYCSPLGRARETAEILAKQRGLRPIVDDRFVEVSFGAWENLTPDEAQLANPAVYAQIFEDGIDLPFGGDGETFFDAAKRMTSAVESVVEAASGEIAVVSHAAITRAYVASMIGLGFSDRNRLSAPRNTASASLLYANGKPTLRSYNVAPHLEH